MIQQSINLFAINELNSNKLQIKTKNNLYKNATLWLYYRQSFDFLFYIAQISN